MAREYIKFAGTFRPLHATARLTQYAKQATRPSDPPPDPKLVCCWCSPSHVLREGAEPASHAMCPVAIEKFERGER